MKKPDKQRAAYDQMMSETPAEKQAFIERTLKGHRGTDLGQTLAALYEVGYVGHVFEYTSPVGTHRLKIELTEVEEGEY
jgi:hypothetical protein